MGFGNAGDEAIAQVMTDQLRAAVPDAEITIVSGDPAHTAAAYHVQAIAWRDPPAMQQAVANTDLTILGGGGLFHDYWGFDPDAVLTDQHWGMSYFVSPALLAAVYGKPLMLYAVGVGPLLSEHGRQYTKVIGDLAARITVRDAASKSLLESLGVAADKIAVTADPAFLLAAAGDGSEIPEVRAWLSRRPAIAVCLRNWSIGVDQAFWERQIAAALDELLASQGGSALFLPFQCGSGLEDDVAVAQRVLAQMRNQSDAAVLTRPCAPAELAGIIGLADLLLGMRLHSLIFSLTAGVPCVALEYDPKVSVLAGMAGIEESAMPLGGIEAESLLRRMRQALSQSAELRAATRARVEGWRRLARQNVAVAAELLRGPGTPMGTEDFQAVFGRMTAQQIARVAERDALRQQLEKTNLRLAQVSHQLDLALAEKVPIQFAALASATKEYEERLARLEAKTLPGIAKRALQIVLDLAEICTPERLRAAVRQYYLHSFYFRLYPERRNARALPASPAQSVLPGASGYAPFLDFKRQLYGGLPLDFAGLSSCRRPGLVSVILPVYNGELFVAQAIESVLAQKYPDFELLVVDDGSTDGTPQILERYAGDPHVRILRQCNQRLPAALNTGFRQAGGEFFTWTSDDNVMHPEQLSELVAFLRAHPNVEMVYADEELIDAAGQPFANTDFCPGYQDPPGSPVIRWPRDPGELNFVQNNYIGGCFLYRSWAGKAAGEYRHFGFEDYDYWMRLNALFRVSHLGVKKPLYQYRLHGASISAKDEQRIAARVRDFMLVEQERRRFFCEGFDVTLVGEHPWFAELAAGYRREGYNVFEAAQLTAATRYHHQITRAFPKSLILSAAPLEGQVDGRASTLALLVDDARSFSPGAASAFDWIVATGDNAWRAVREEFAHQGFLASAARQCAFPLLAVTNAQAWRRREPQLPY